MESNVSRRIIRWTVGKGGGNKRDYARGNLRRTITSTELVEFYSDKKSHSRYSYSVGFFSGKDSWHQYSIDNCTRSLQLSAVSVWALRKIVHTFSLNAPLPDQYGIDKLVQESTQLQSHPSVSQSAGVAAEGGRMGFAYSQCSGPYDYIWLHWNDQVFNRREASIDGAIYAAEGFVASWSSRPGGQGAWCTSYLVPWVGHRILRVTVPFSIKKYILMNSLKGDKYNQPNTSAILWRGNPFSKKAIRDNVMSMVLSTKP